MGGFSQNPESALLGGTRASILEKTSADVERALSRPAGHLGLEDFKALISPLRLSIWRQWRH